MDAKCCSHKAFKINWSMIGIMREFKKKIVSKMYYKYSNTHF
jgi:hypothetical protein